MFKKLSIIQSQLKAPKSQFNDFGKYKYRNLEDIEVALKPLLLEQNLVMVITDTIEMIGDRYYVKAKATLIDIESGDEFFATAYAREAQTKKGMDDSQITGSTSSYARKYCLSGLFLIDNTTDADSYIPLITSAQINVLTKKVKEIEPLAENKEFKVAADRLGINSKTTTMQEFENIWEREKKMNFKTIKDLFK